MAEDAQTAEDADADSDTDADADEVMAYPLIPLGGRQIGRLN
ncbi:hypothetical protein [Streptomyces sp. YPW6]|nr:hypothetical protein [Streptomyces sp. YPW6]